MRRMIGAEGPVVVLRHPNDIPSAFRNRIGVLLWNVRQGLTTGACPMFPLSKNLNNYFSRGPNSEKIAWLWGDRGWTR